MTSIRRVSLGALMFLSSLSFAAGHARAQSAVDKNLAQQLFEQARKLMNDNKVDEACPKFAEAYRLDPGGGVLLNLALCHEKQNKLALAYAEFRESAVRAANDARPEREKFAREKMAAIEPKLGRLTVNVTAAAAATDGIEVRLDGVVLQKPAWGVSALVDQGEHVVEARAPGKKPWTFTATIARGGEVRSVEVPPLAGESTTPPTPTPTTTATTPPPATTTAPPSPPPTATEATQMPPLPPPSSDGSTQRTLALVALGVGVVGLGVGSYFGIRASGKWNDAQNAHTNRPQLSSDAASAADVSTAAFIVGGVGVAAAAFLYFTAPSGVKVAPSVGRDGAGLFVRGSL